MNKFKCLLTAIALTIAPNLTAQDVLNDSTAQKKTARSGFCSHAYFSGIECRKCLSARKKVSNH
jgi:hypothetical protein